MTTPPAQGARSVRSALTALLAIAAVTVPASPAAASGFLLPPASGESLGLAGASTAQIREPAAVWQNPAALAFISEERAISVGGTLLEFATRFTSADSGVAARSRPGLKATPALFAHSRVMSWLTVGLGLHAPWGLATRWPAGWQGARQALETRIEGTATTLALGLQLHPRLALGAGTSFVRGRVAFRAALPADARGEADLWGNGWASSRAFDAGFPLGALAGHLALTWRVLPEVLDLAVVFHARTPLEMNGHVDFSSENPNFGEIYIDQRVRTDLELPDRLVIAACVRPRPGFTLSAEAERVRWSTIPRLGLDFERAGTADIVIERGSRDPFSARAGGELWLPRRPFALRAGLVFHGSATPAEHLEPGAPDGSRLGIAAGVGYLVGRIKLDVGYLYTHFLPAEARPRAIGPEAQPAGTYRSRLHALTATLTVR